jgi:hypothetical protein
MPEMSLVWPYTAPVCSQEHSGLAFVYSGEKILELLVLYVTTFPDVFQK